MNQIRTTITLPEDTHQYLLMMSVQKKKSLGVLIDALVKNKNFFTSDVDKQNDFSKFQLLCRSIAQKAGDTDWVRLLRQERNRDE